MINWLDNKSKEEKEDLLSRFRDEIAYTLNFSLIGPDGYTIIFTSSQAESNSTILMSSIRSFIKLTSKKPHIIMSNLEHKSSLLLANDMKEEHVDFTILDNIDLKTIADAIRPNTCIISIIYYCPYLGIMNDIESIGELAKKNKIPFHSDISHIFERKHINPRVNNITTFTATFRNIPSVSLLVIKNSFIEGYKIKSMIYGNENFFLRGGEECIHNIAMHIKIIL